MEKGAGMVVKNGFSLVELIIAIVILGIISLVAAVSYRGYKEKVIEAEAKAMLAEVAAAQQIYYERNKEYLDVSDAMSNNSSLGVDFRKNKYFTSFTIESVD